MSFAATVALGAVAGFTIFLGLPFGRIRAAGRGFRTFMSGLSAGILVFLFFDILSNASGPLEDALNRATNSGAWGPFTGMAVLYAAGFGVGLLGLLYVPRRRARPKASLGPGAMAIAEADPR